MSKIENVYFVLTEEGMESPGKTAYEALSNYLAAGAGDTPFEKELDWLNKVIEGKSEIVEIVEMTRAEYKEWLKTAIEV